MRNEGRFYFKYKFSGITGCKKSETIIYVSDLNLTMFKSLNKVIAIVGKHLFKLKYNLTSIQILTRHHQMVLPQF